MAVRRMRSSCCDASPTWARRSSKPKPATNSFAFGRCPHGLTCSTAFRRLPAPKMPRHRSSPKLLHLPNQLRGDQEQCVSVQAASRRSAAGRNRAEEGARDSRQPGDGTFSLSSAALRKPVAMAYDSASNRFVFADDETETLKVLGRMSSRVEDLVRRRWAGSFRTTALAIDDQRGDLWVSGADADAVGGARSVLHRMQLISGRLLYSIEMPGDLGSVTLTDIVISGSRILALDSSGLRLVALTNGAKTPQVQAELNGLESPTSVAPVNDGAVYVSHENGIARIAAGARRPTFLKASKDVDLTGFRWIRYHDGALIGIQQRGRESQTLVRVRLEKSGASARSIEVLDNRRTTTAVLAGDVLVLLDGGTGRKWPDAPSAGIAVGED